jgi:hypothetical protein
LKSFAFQAFIQKNPLRPLRLGVSKGIIFGSEDGRPFVNNNDTIPQIPLEVFICLSIVQV